jgi:hypothetical protein
MDFFGFALQITVVFCGLPIILISCLITLVINIMCRKHGKMLTLSRLVAYFLISMLLCFILILAGNWFFLLVGVESTQGF